MPLVPSGPIDLNGSAQRATAKVILIGLDSADQQLVQQGCDSGDLPVLRSLRDRGAYGLLSGFDAMADDALWASFYTGLSPGQHGRYFWNYPEPGTYQRRLYRDRKPSLKPFWAQLSQSGLRSAVIDVPKCPLVTEFNGVQVADWLVHGRDHSETCSWPVELAGDLLRVSEMTARTAWIATGCAACNPSHTTNWKRFNSTCWMDWRRRPRLLANYWRKTGTCFSSCSKKRIA